jgi:hypothetical protein
MAWLKWLVAVALLFGACCFGQARPDNANETPISSTPVFSISVDPPVNPMKLGASIEVKVTVTNISNEKIGWESAKSDTAYQAFNFSLTKGGRETETTAFNRKITGRPRPEDPPEIEFGSSIASFVSPGQSFSFSIDLKRLYQISDPGTYVLDVSRFDDYSKMTVRSKAVTFDIVP